MALKKCPRCELNYILDGGTVCTVCRRELKGEQERDPLLDLCSVCNENPALPGKDMCLFCLKEMGTPEPVEEKPEEPVEAALEMDGASTMEEIAIDVENDIPDRELGEIDRELSLDEVLEDEEALDTDDQQEDV